MSLSNEGTKVIHSPFCYFIGANNTVKQVDVVPDEDSPENEFYNAFYAKAKTLTTEGEAKAHLNLETTRTWKIINQGSKNKMGDDVGYKFVPGIDQIRHD
jgi:primary-amine oxidase